MIGESPSGAHEGGAIDSGNIRARVVMGADITGQHAAGNPGTELVERTMAAPAIGHAAYFLIESAAEIAWTPDTVEPAALSVGVGSVIRGREAPLPPPLDF